MVLIPVLITSGFIPEDVLNIPILKPLTELPQIAWPLIAGIGTLVGFPLYTNRIIIGSLCGALIGLGAFFGAYHYVFLRQLVFDNDRYFAFEFAIGGLIGAIPGLILYAILKAISDKIT